MVAILQNRTGVYFRSTGVPPTLTIRVPFTNRKITFLEHFRF